MTFPSDAEPRGRTRPGAGLSMGRRGPASRFRLRFLGLLILLAWAPGILVAAPSGVAPDPRGPGTLRMAARLRTLAENADPMANPYLSAGQASRLEETLREHPDNGRDPGFRYHFGQALLNAGRNREALVEFERVETLMADAGTPLTGTNRVNVLLNIALCHLREGERLNCLSNHNADSCLLPLRQGALHVVPEPSRRALGVLRRLLSEFPGDMAARWVLNVASMTVGEYPGGVPGPLLIPESVFASEAPFPRFRDLAPGAGLAVNELSGASVVEDFDGDEQLDVVVTSIGLSDPMHFFRNRGDGTFADATREAGLEGLTGGLHAIAADYDNDGDLDLLVLRGGWMRESGCFPNSLLRNRGDGTFDDVTEEAGMLSFHPTQAAAWLDFDGDGWLDLFVGNESLIGVSRHPCELFLNQRDGTFRDVARQAGVSGLGYVKGVTVSDFNHDGRPDLYLSTLGGRNRLYRNDGPRDAARGAAGGWVFTDVALIAGVQEPIDSFPSWFFDFDNDGWDDLFVAGYRIGNVGDVAADVLGLPNPGTRARLYRNRGDGRFDDVTVAAHLDRVLHTMGCSFGDLDNDGWLDFYLGTADPDLLTLIPNRMFRNAGDGRFLDITSAGGFGHLQKGHGVSFADLDNDGDQDVHEDMGGAVSGDVYPNVLYENPGMGHHWLKLRLEGVKANRSAVGARVRVSFEEAGRTRTVYRHVGPGGSFGGNPLRLEIGLGEASRIVSVDIEWPGSGTHQSVAGLQRDRMYRVREGDPSPRDIALKPFRFPAEDPLCDPVTGLPRVPAVGPRGAVDSAK